MKFSKKNTILQDKFPGFAIYEAEGRDVHSVFWALIKGVNGRSPLKVNKSFHEIYYVIKGEMEFIANGKKKVIREGEYYMSEPDVPHRVCAKYVEMFVVCSPSFDIRDVEFLEE